MGSKSKRQDRFLQKLRHIGRQTKIAKACGINFVAEQPHRNHKKSAVTCGNANCVMCGNPRKFFGEVTMQEVRFEGYCEVID